MFSVTIVSSVDHMAKQLNLVHRLNQRTLVSCENFDKMMQRREMIHNQKSYSPKGLVNDDSFFPGTVYLEHIDEKYRRMYKNYC
jgi:3-hydroxy-3-methylglutaryl CoA synthase